jgi:hypothetical protein
MRHSRLPWLKVRANQGHRMTIQIEFVPSRTGMPPDDLPPPWLRFYQRQMRLQRHAQRPPRVSARAGAVD